VTVLFASTCGAHAENSHLFPDVVHKAWPTWLGKNFWAYGAVAGIVAIAFAARFGLSQVFGPGAPLLPFIPAILIGAWLGGFGPGMLATALGAVCGAYFFLAPDFQLSNLQLQQAARLGLFIVAGTIISALVEQMHRARRRAETSEAQLSAILGQLPVGVGVVDQRGRFVLTNRLMEGLSIPRMPSEDPERRGRWIVHDLKGQPLEASMWPAARALRGERVEPGIECRYTNDAGEHVWYSIASAPMRKDDGSVDGAVVVIQDIDRIKRAAAALEEADRRKDAFLATLAHELRNPLAPIRNAVEMLKLRGPKDPLVDATKGVIDRQVTHLARLVDDLMDVSRITRDRLELRLEDVTVQDVVEQALEIVRPQIDRAGQSLVVSMPSEAMVVRADPIRLAQVLTNVLSNASKFSGEDGVITLTVSARAPTAIVTVEDNGIGIEPGHIPALFEMFSQGSPATTTRAQAGLGIGLWLSRRLIEMHGGTIDAASEGAGKGSRFTLRLPMQTGSPAEPRAAVPDLHETGRALRVQVVEDNVDGAATLAELLRDAGHDVEIAHDGVQALTLAERFRPDFMLLDLGLPRLDGREVCRRIRRQPWGRRMSIVAMTGWGQEEDRRRSVTAGFDAHLVKPVDYATLSDVLQRGPMALKMD